MKQVAVLGCVWCALAGLLEGAEPPEKGPPPLRAPAGFRVTEFVSDRQAHDIFCLTFDAQGRLVVSGPGYVRRIIDEDGDGVGDTVQTFAAGPQSGAQGMYFQGRHLLCVGDGGLWRYSDDDGDGRADGSPVRLLSLRTGGEHDSHAVQLGPEGWWYLIAGNTAEITEKHASLPTSPVKRPRAGALLRFTPDLSRGEIFADGLRNAYDFALHSAGDVLIFDSDDEREMSLPWYRPTRVFHTLAGADHGWVSRGWKRPNYFCDMPPVVGSFGRGSPTGMVCYRHTQFPADYHDAVFALDWTYGRVWCLRLSPSGETWTSRSEVFLSGVDGYGFAPTDCDVGPDGCLYVSVGGRGTRGAVYRVQAVDTPPGVLPASELESCLAAPQPLASWSRERWLPQAQTLGRQPFVDAAKDANRPAAQRIRAIEILTEVFGGLDEATLEALSDHSVAGVDRQGHLVRARAVWSWGRTQGARLEPAVLARWLADPHPMVVRSALEAALNLDPQRDWRPLSEPLVRVLGGEFRFNRQLAMLVVSRAPTSLLAELSQAATKHGPRAVISYAAGWLAHPHADLPRVRKATVPLALAVLRGDYPPDLKLDALRLLQWMLGDLGPSERHSPAFDGYAPGFDLQPLEREFDELRGALAEVYPTGLTVVDQELSRVLAMLSPTNQRLLDKILSRLTDQSDPIDDLHHLLVAARLPVPRSAVQRQVIAKALVQLDAKFTRLKLPQDSAWNDRVRELYTRLCEVDEHLAAALVDVEGFGRPGHVVFMSQMPAARLTAALSAFVRQIQNDPDYPWNNDVVFLLGSSDDPAHRQLVRSLYDRFAVRGAVLMTLSERPDPADRAWFREGLSSSQAEVVEACLTALEALPADPSAEEQTALLRALRRLGGDAREYRLRERVVKLLERNTGHREPFVFGEAGHQPQAAAIAAWTRWIESRWPMAALSSTVDPDVAALPQRLKSVDWSRGDAARGARLFEARTCGQCHGGRSALGPDLAGVTGRFSREDLFTAIVDPSRDVSARYQTTILQTRQGRTLSGLIVYESVDGLLLRNATQQTFRVETRDIEERRQSPVSLMPMGLLKDLTPADYADLYAYLATLGRKGDGVPPTGSGTP
jgi:putative membrane-bound dehydrogenase-like protein